MDIPVGILFGIFAMIAWGVADFFAAHAVRKAEVFQVALWSQVVGIILYLVVFFAFFETPLLSTKLTLYIIASGVLGAVSNLAIYKAFQVGKVSVVSPLISGWVVVTVVLSILFLGEILTKVQMAGMLLAIVGAILASFKLHDLFQTKIASNVTGIEYALVGLVGWGVSFVFIGALVSSLGWFIPIVLTRLVLLFCLLSYSTIKKMNVSFPTDAVKPVLLVGLLEVAAFLAYGFGISSAYTSVVASVTAAFPVITIILGRIFFKETLELNQDIGVALVMTGVLVLSI